MYDVRISIPATFVLDASDTVDSSHLRSAHAK